jgi:hypothetical protein
LEPEEGSKFPHVHGQNFETGLHRMEVRATTDAATAASTRHIKGGHQAALLLPSVCPTPADLPHLARYAQTCLAGLSLDAFHDLKNRLSCTRTLRLCVRGVTKGQGHWMLWLCVRGITEPCWAGRKGVLLEVATIGSHVCSMAGRKGVLLEVAMIGSHDV